MVKKNIDRRRAQNNLTAIKKIVPGLAGKVVETFQKFSFIDPILDCKIRVP
jgi:hypothetical protein